MEMALRRAQVALQGPVLHPLEDFSEPRLALAGPGRERKDMMTFRFQGLATPQKGVPFGTLSKGTHDSHLANSAHEPSFKSGTRATFQKGHTCPISRLILN